MARSFWGRIFSTGLDSDNIGAAARFGRTGDIKELASVLRNQTLQKQFDETEEVSEVDAEAAEEAREESEYSALVEARDDAEAERNTNYKARRASVPTAKKNVADFDLDTDEGFQEYLDSMKR